MVKTPLGKFITAQRLRMKYKSIDLNPYLGAAPSDPHADHWKVLVYIQEGESRRKFRTYFTKGSGHCGKPPTLKEILDCVAMDARMIENSGDFADFCDESGYDLSVKGELRRAMKVYKVCKREARKLKEFLGPAAFDQLLELESE